MQYNKEINDQLKRINDILFSFKENDLLNNPGYTIDDSSCERHLKIRFIKENHLYFSLAFSTEGLVINMDRTVDTITLPYNKICKGYAILELFYLLYFSKVVVEYIGNHYTCIKFYNKNNYLEKKIIDNTAKSIFLSKLFIRKKTHKYFPIIEQDMMIIHSITNTNLVIEIPSHKASEYVNTILKYLYYDTSLFGYLLFGYNEGNSDIAKYADCYPELGENKGFIRLKEQDILDESFIIAILDEFQTASLFINKIPDLEKKYGFEDMRVYISLFEGYVIRELKYGYIDILKDDELPEWQNLIDKLTELELKFPHSL